MTASVAAQLSRLMPSWVCGRFQTRGSRALRSDMSRGHWSPVCWSTTWAASGNGDVQLPEPDWVDGLRRPSRRPGDEDVCPS